MASRTRSRSFRRAALLTAGLVGTALVLGIHGSVVADERPTEIPYDTPGQIPLLDPTYRMASHKVVLITDQALNPRLAKLEEGQLVAWISYAKIPSVVVFEREVAKDMICHSLINFSIKDDELRSAPIHAGEFASFCQLKPGRYVYNIVRPNPGDRSAAARKRLRGEIIVGNPGGS